MYYALVVKFSHSNYEYISELVKQDFNRTVKIHLPFRDSQFSPVQIAEDRWDSLLLSIALLIQRHSFLCFERM